MDEFVVVDVKVLGMIRSVCYGEAGGERDEAAIAACRQSGAEVFIPAPLR